jgi:hypothetical protein
MSSKKQKGARIFHEMKVIIVRLAIGLILAGFAWFVAMNQVKKMGDILLNSITKSKQKAEQGAAANP